MGAPELLHHLRDAGLVLTLTPTGGLHVAPRTALTDDHRVAIRTERDALVLALRVEASRPPPPRCNGDPLLTPEQGDECDACGWDDALDTWNVYIPPGTSAATIAKFRAASLALDAAQRAAGIPPLGNPDADCWPHSMAMIGAEIDTFEARVAHLSDMGIDLDAGERLADKLVIRDREQDDRRQCLECLHLHGGRRCGNWQRAGVAVRARDAQLPTDFVDLLQRCDGFSDAVPMTPPRHQIIASRASCTIWRPI